MATYSCPFSEGLRWLHKFEFIPLVVSLLIGYYKYLALDLIFPLLRIINNSSSLNKGHHDPDGVWISDLNLHLFLRFVLSFSFDWEDISNTQDSVESQFQTPQISSKILRCAPYFQLSLRCLEMWRNTVFPLWCNITKTPRRELKIQRTAEYFWRHSRCLDSQWNTVSSVWYINKN